MPSFTLSEVAPGQVIKAAQAKAALLRQTAKNTVSYSSTPTFDLSLGSQQQITLTGDVSSSSISNISAGQRVTFKIIQDATGGRAFTWPTEVLGGMTIDAATPANAVCIQEFECFDGTNLEACNVGAIR